MVGTCSLRFSRKLDNMLRGLLLRSEGAWYDCRNCEETSLSSHLLVCYRMWWIRWQILGVADGATTQWHTYVIKNRMKRHWTISRQQNSLYFCVGSSRMREWSDDSPRARAHVYVRLALPLMLSWKSLVGTIKNRIWGAKTDYFAVQTIPRPQHNG